MANPPSAEPIKVQTLVEADPKTVFALMSDARFLAKWFRLAPGAKATFGRRMGGAVRLEFPQRDCVVSGEVVEFVPDSRIAFTWGQRPGPHADVLPPGSSRVEVTITPQGEHSLVALVHHGVPAGAAHDDHLEGWTDLIGELARIVAENQIGWAVNTLFFAGLHFVRSLFKSRRKRVPESDH